MTNELGRKVNRALKLIQSAGRVALEHGQPLEICYSGGKDSDVILELAKLSGVEFKAIYKNTTIDPPGTIAHVKANGVEVLQPKLSFAELIAKKGLPSRMRRHCCGILKEYKVLPLAVIGVRRDESSSRALYAEPTVCRQYKKGDCAELYMPLLDWTVRDVSEFISVRGIRCHPLYYDEKGAFHPERRLGCIGCPLAYKKHRIEEFKQFPGMVRLYIKAAQKFLNEHPESHTLVNFKDAVEWFTFSLYCDTMDEWRYKFGPTLFDSGIDCRQHLSDLFGIDI